MALDDWGVPRRDDHRAWTQRELSIMRRMATTHSWAEVAQVLERTPCAIKGKAAKTGISFRKYGEAHHATRFDESALRRIYDLKAQGWSNQRIADEIGTSRQHILAITTYQWRFREFMKIEAEHERDHDSA